MADSPNRDLFLKQGSELIVEELDNQASFVVALRQEVELRNVQLLSADMIANKNLHKNIKAKITEHSQNIQKIVLATAHFIEQEKFSSVDEAIENLSLAKFDKNRLTNLVNAQKNLSYSYSTISVLVELFKMANRGILDKIAETGPVNSVEGRLDKTALYLKNAIIVYELTNFAINQLSTFQLTGINDIKVIQKEVYQDMEKLRIEDEKLKKRLEEVDEEFRNETMRDIEQRAIMSNRIKQKWEEMLDKIDEQTDSINNAKKFIIKLEIINSNVKSRIDILNIAATTALIEKSIDTVSELASNMQGLALPALDEKTACELLGLEI